MIKYIFFFESPSLHHFLQQFSFLASFQKLHLFIPTVLCVLLSAFNLFIFPSFRVVEDVPVGLNDVLLLFEIHLEHTLDQHKGYSTLWRQIVEGLSYLSNIQNSQFNDRRAKCSNAADEVNSQV